MRERHHATLAEPLIDEELWAPLLESIRTTRRRIDLTQLLFEADFAPIDVPLSESLERAAARGVRVRILLNENAAIPDSVDEIRTRFHGAAIDVRALTMSPNVLHSKLLILDDEAYLVDAPFEQKYADTRVHHFDARARDGHSPFHTVSFRLQGPVVDRLAELFGSLWRQAPVAPAPPSGRGNVELSATSPPGVWAEGASSGILDAYADALARARRFVYVETQYLTSPRIVELIGQALAREPRLEVILVLNEHMDVPTYDAWQARRLSELGHPDHPRLGVFSLWSPRRAADKGAVRSVYVHSKVAIVDDEWFTLGSANLDSLSLHEAEEFGFVAPRNIELNVSFDDAARAADLRRRLWGEHLGDAGVWRAGEPPGGWLAHWRALAQGNLARVRAGDSASMVGHVLPLGAVPLRGRLARLLSRS